MNFLRAMIPSSSVMSYNQKNTSKQKLGIMASRIYRRIEGWKVFFREMKMRKQRAEGRTPNIPTSNDGHE
jgi:hypothetical protein